MTYLQEFEMNRFGALKDKFDKRDWAIGNFITKKVKELPQKVDYSNKLTPVRNQGDEPTCVAFASCAMKEYQEDTVEKKSLILSPRYLYTRIKQPQGGAYPRDSLSLLRSSGVPPEDCNPYIPQVPTEECPQARTRACPNRIQGYARLNTIEEMKLSLFENGPFLAALLVSEGWNAPQNGIVKHSGAVEGGHAICFVGYDKSTQLFKFKNSWGEEWGDHGYGYISNDDVKESLMDAWSAVDVPEKEEGQIRKKSLWESIVEFVVNYLTLKL